MKHLLRLLLTLAPACLPAQDLPAGADPAEGADEARRYAVEVIIFRYDELEAVGTEIFVPERLEDDAGIPVFGDAAGDPARTSRPGAGAVDAAHEALPAELHYRPMAPDEYTLQDTLGMLRRLQAYEPLMHFGWVQDTVAEADTPPLSLDRFGTPPAGLAGTLSLRLSRFLHLGVDLSLAADEPYAPPGDARPDDISQPGQALPRDRETTPRYAPLRYEIAETRIIRVGETRYYDHPRFGVIARVSRVDEAGEAPGGG